MFNYFPFHLWKMYENPGPETYAFGYEIKSPHNNNAQFREEEKFGDGSIHGSHGYVRPDGYVSVTHYTADESGFHSAVESFMDPSFPEGGTQFPTDDGLMVRADTIKDIISKQHGIDATEGLKHLHPKIASVINGEVSLTSKHTDAQGERRIGFFIPDNFHLSTFEVPTNKTN